MFRNENIGWQIQQRRIPTGEKSRGALKAEREQAPLSCQAMIIERIDPVRDVDVVAGEPGRRLDPARVEAEVRISFKKRERQYVAGAVGEEMPVGPVPSPDWIVLDVNFWKEHRRAKPDFEELLGAALAPRSPELLFHPV